MSKQVSILIDLDDLKEEFKSGHVKSMPDCIRNGMLEVLKGQTRLSLKICIKCRARQFEEQFGKSRSRSSLLKDNGRLSKTAKKDFLDQWSAMIVKCPFEVNGYNMTCIFDDPPDKCPFYLEHAVDW
jgi:hypothetical protein